MSSDQQENSSGRRFFDWRNIPSRLSSTLSHPSTLIPSTHGNHYISNSVTGPMDYGQNLDQHQASQSDVPVNNIQGTGILTQELVPANNNLAVFRTMIGIDNAPALLNLPYSRRFADNVGIYGRVVRSEDKCCRRFKIYSLLINGCLGLQIVFAAALTALGAGRGPHSLVTIFGAINTVIAGIMTYLKGSGLPHKVKYYEQEWTRIREYIEQCERDFCREGCTLNVNDIVREIEEMYDQVKSDIEMNSSDGIVSMSDVQKKRDKLIGNQPSNRPGLSRAVSFNVKPQGLEHCPTCQNHDHKLDLHSTVYPLPSSKAEISPDGGKEKGDPHHMV